jgi:site-specific DNA recombinase
MRATFYARVSTNSDEQRNSITSQVDFFQDYIEKHKFQSIDSGVFFKRDGTAENTNGYYVDEGFSGAKSIKYRKAFLQMMKDAKSRKFDIIFTKNISRFGRNVQEILKSIGDLKELGIGVYFEDVNINTLNSTDDVKVTIFAAMAQEESRSKSDSVQFGKMRGYKKGIWGGREPFGYNLVEGKLVIDKVEMEIVREIFNLYLNECLGLSRICKILNAKDTPTKRKKTLWNQSLCSKVLKNAVYTGEIRLHRTQKIDINRNIVKKIPLNEQVITQDENLRMIDDETFKQVQIEKEKRFESFGDFKYRNVQIEDENGELLEKKIRTIIKGDTRHSNTHLFSNLLKCGNCGGSLRRKVQKNKNQTYLYWFCRNNDAFGKSKCKYRNLQNEENLLDFVKNEISDYKVNEITHALNLDNIIKANYDIENIEEKINESKEVIEELTNEREMNFKLHSRKKIDEDEYLERNKRLNKDLYDAKSKMNQMIYIEDEIEKVKNQSNKFIGFLKGVDLNNLTNATLRKIISSITATTYDENDQMFLIQRKQIILNDLKIDWLFMDKSFTKISDEFMLKHSEIYEDYNYEEILNISKIDEVFGVNPR